MDELKVVGAAVIKDGKVLAARRSGMMRLPFKWEFPGGKVEQGEGLEQALKREILEELGVTVEVGEFVAAGFDMLASKKVVLAVYEAKIISGELKNLEHSEIKWVDIDGLGELDWADADIPACRELMRKYGSSWC